MDIDLWIDLAYTKNQPVSMIDEDFSRIESELAKRYKDTLLNGSSKKNNSIKNKYKKISRQKFLNLKNHLQDNVIGQQEAITSVVSALKRSQVGLNDKNRPLGIFLFAGSSGVGKTHLASTLHKYLFSE